MGLFAKLFKRKEKAPQKPSEPEVVSEKIVSAEDVPTNIASPEVEPVEEEVTEVPAEAPVETAPEVPAETAIETEPEVPTEAAVEAAHEVTAEVAVEAAHEVTAEVAFEAAKETTPKKSTTKTAKSEKTTEKKVPVKKDADSKLPFVTSEKELNTAFSNAMEEAEKQIAQNEGRAVGKYEFHLEEDGYHFTLIANNGQALFDSPSFTTLLGALSGIKTFQKAVADTEFNVKKDKFNRYRFILANKYYGENYDSKEQCQRSAESVKNFANNSRIVAFRPDADSLAIFEAANKVKRLPADVDWNAVAEKEAAATKMGKFEICREEDAYCFYLLANNGQILYSSRSYSTEAACRRGIESFKRATYVGNFYVDPDKFGTYRFVLKNIGSAPSFIGESYDNRQQCERIIESVKNFVVTATIELAPDEE